MLEVSFGGLRTSVTAFFNLPSGSTVRGIAYLLSSLEPGILIAATLIYPEPVPGPASIKKGIAGLFRS